MRWGMVGKTNQSILPAELRRAEQGKKQMNQAASE